MKKLGFVLLLSSFFSVAGDYQTSVGFGHQYGGVLGGKLAYQTQSTQFYGSLGLVGFALGAQTTFTENAKHAFGLSVGKEGLTSEDGFAFITYDYFFNGFNHSGLVLGTGIGVMREDEGSWFFDHGETESESAITLSIGYQF